MYISETFISYEDASLNIYTIIFKFRHYADNMQNLSTWKFYKQKK